MTGQSYRMQMTPRQSCPHRPPQPRSPRRHRSQPQSCRGAHNCPHLPQKRMLSPRDPFGCCRSRPQKTMLSPCACFCCCWTAFGICPLMLMYHSPGKIRGRQQRETSAAPFTLGADAVLFRCRLWSWFLLGHRWWGHRSWEVSYDRRHRRNWILTAPSVVAAPDKPRLLCKRYEMNVKLVNKMTLRQGVQHDAHHALRWARRTKRAHAMARA